MKKVINNIGIGFLIGTILTALQLVFHYFTKKEFSLNSATLVVYGFYLLYTIPLTAVNSAFFAYLNVNVNWEKFSRYRVLIGIIGSTLISLFTIFLIRVIHMVVIEGLSFEDFLAGEQSKFYLICLVITLLISLIFHAAYFYKELQKSKVAEQKVIAGTASAKFDALKNQLDPHFLFNSLNVLGSLIEENPESAQEFTISLSQVYRYVLEQKSKALVTVDEELKFARTYMTLLKMRFEDSIQFEFLDKATDPESKVVPLSLQLLLENAVKHNVVNDSRPLRIKIFEQDGALVVQNNLQPKEVLKKSSGVGLTNIRQRYQLLSNRQVEISQSERVFKVSLPMLTKPIKVMNMQEQVNYDSKYIRAKKRVEEIKEFYFNLVSFCVVMPFLIFIYFYRTPDVFQWFWFPLLGWGVGLTLHGYKVFVNDGRFGANWERKKIEQFMQEEESNNLNQ